MAATGLFLEVGEDAEDCVEDVEVALCCGAAEQLVCVAIKTIDTAKSTAIVTAA